LPADSQRRLLTERPEDDLNPFIVMLLRYIADQPFIVSSAA
jgi:hypothetical protein